jgi:TolB-like protein
VADRNLSRHLVKFGDFEADLVARELHKNGVKLRLQDQPFHVLAVLLEYPGEVISREELRQKLWPGDTFVDFDKGLNTAVNKIREVLGDSVENPRFIETLPKRGYRFIGASQPASGRMESLLVLPLENLSHDPEQEYFADGMTEALIMSLAKIRALRVVSRTTAMHYKRVHRPLREIARELGVDVIVEGTVQRSGERLRISTQLIQAKTDTHLWAESYERDMRDVLTLQTEVARAIANEIRVKLTPQEEQRLAETRHVDPEAYEFYLKGRYYWIKRTSEAMTKGVCCFEHAIEKDPSYAAAYAGLADSASRLGFWGFVNAEDGCGRAKKAALKGLALDDSVAEVQTAYAFAVLNYDYDVEAAETAARRALALDPRSSFAHQALAISLMARGLKEEAIAETLRSIELDPLSLILLWTAATYLHMGGYDDRSLVISRKALELDPNFLPTRWSAGLALAHKQMHEAGIAEMENAVRLSGRGMFYLGGLGHCYALIGRHEDARAIVGELKGQSKKSLPSAFWQALALAPVEEWKDECFLALEAARLEHAPWLAYIKSYPWFVKLHSDPRFPELLRRMKTYQYQPPPDKKDSGGRDIGAYESQTD